MTDQELVRLALNEKEKAYAPYSGFKVGAVLLTENGKLYTGVNIENLSFGATNCAERTAVFKAVSDGEMKIKVIAISSDSTEVTYPCGICRQVLMEFADADTRVLCSNNKGDYIATTMREILPHAFDEKAFTSRQES